MRLSDSTQVRVICGGSALAVYDPGKPATVFNASADNVFPCGWLYPIVTEDGPGAAECEAPAVGLDNGFVCAHGHSHRSDVEYYEQDEIDHVRRAGHMPAMNARLMDGSMPR